jgi:hypothetical protein
MKKDRTAKILTFVVLGALLSVVWIRRNGIGLARTAVETGPEDAVYAMLEAARTGNTQAYLAHYADPIARDLRQAVGEKTEDGFRRYLVASDAGIKGVALGDPKPSGGGEVTLRVEYVYRDRNEAQMMYLIRKPDGWKISRVESAERVKTLVPYGTPVQ